MVDIQQLQVTPASAWEQETGLLQLEPGRVVEVKEVDLISLVLTADAGEVPDFLMGPVMKMLDGAQVDLSKAVRTDNLKDIAQLVDLMVLAGTVRPKVVRSDANRQRGEINLADIRYDLRLKIFEVVMPGLEANTAYSFRNRLENANVANLPDEQGNGQPPKRTAKSKK